MAARIKIEFDDGESITKNVYSEEDDGAPTWPEILESFLTALQGFGYCLPDNPENIRQLVENYMQEKATQEALEMNKTK